MPLKNGRLSSLNDDVVPGCKTKISCADTERRRRRRQNRSFTLWRLQTTMVLWFLRSHCLCFFQPFYSIIVSRRIPEEKKDTSRHPSCRPHSRFFLFLLAIFALLGARLDILVFRSPLLARDIFLHWVHFHFHPRRVVDAHWFGRTSQCSFPSHAAFRSAAEEGGI